MSDKEQKTSTATPVSEKKSTDTGPGYIEVLVLALIVAAAAIFGYDYFFAQKVVVVDLKGYVRQQNALLAAGQITREQWQEGLDRVDGTVEAEAMEHPSHVFLLKDVVLKNGEELHVR